MKWMRHRLQLLAFGMLALTLAGCRPEPSLKPVDSFAHFEKHYFSALFRWSPSYGTLAGLHDHDRALEDWSAQAHQNRVAELRQLRDRLSLLDRSPLTPGQRLDAELLGSQIEAELFDLAGLQTWRKNPMAYVAKPGEAVDALMKRDFAPVAERVDRVASRLRHVPALLEAMRANVREPAREFTELALVMAKGSVDFFRSTVPEWAAANGRSGALAEPARAAAAAMQNAAEWLEKELLPRSTGQFAIGAEAFARKLRHEEMIDIPLDRLLAMGEENLRRDLAAFRETAARVAPGKPPAQAMAMLPTIIPPSRICCPPPGPPSKRSGVSCSTSRS